MYLVAINGRNLLRVISSVHEWMLPFNDDLLDIREEMTRFMDELRDATLPMFNNFRYISIAGFLTVFANLAQHQIVWVPFWASVYFAGESLHDLVKLNFFGDALNQNIEHAEQTVIEREYEGAMEAVQEALSSQEIPEE